MTERKAFTPLTVQLVGEKEKKSFDVGASKLDR